MKNKHEYMSLRKAAKELGVNRMWLAGHLAALGINLMPLGNSRAVRRSDLRRVKLPSKESIA